MNQGSSMYQEKVGQEWYKDRLSLHTSMKKAKAGLSCSEKKILNQI